MAGVSLGSLKVAITVIVGVLMLATDAQNPNVGQGAAHRRFEYKYSFKPPYLAQKDGTVPFFEYSGSKFLLSIMVS